MAVALCGEDYEITDRSDPVLAEFGHQCHCCARSPCEKAKAGEPDGDCWEYEKKGG